MKKQKEIFVLGAMLVFSFLLMSGCTQQSVTEESIQTILQKANIVGDVYYEVIGITSIEGGGYSYNSTYIMKVWQKMPYMKTETTDDETTQIIIFRPDGSYTYNNQTQNYMKLLPSNNQTQPKFLEGLANDLMQSQTLKVLGNDTIDGKAATIVQYSYAALEMVISPKLWIWNEKGIPLKIEINSMMMEVIMTTTTEYKNFIFGEIPDNTFDVS
jgi:outer membrane lipoprotein-sorting protein